MPRSSEHSPRVVGRYVLHNELASGGMATVHLGRLSGPVGFSRTVAIKRLHPHYAKDPEFVTMFLDEARLVGRIRHPNVVPTLDVVTTEGEIFIVMEYVAGEALSKLLKVASTTKQPIPLKVVATILSSVLHGLHAAHQTKDEHGRELGIVHRDVSPQNILVGADGAARVLDFGVAKAAGRLQTTREGQLKGKIAYMPPEQLSGAPATRQVDIYAASVVLWEALATRRLFDGETEAVVLARAIEGQIDPPSTHNPLVSPAVDEVVLRGLSREPEKRFATAREMALAIEQTMGLASPSEVGEWVERLASAELHRRAATVAAIEVASLGEVPVETVASAGPPTADAHSQVSSISVSRPAISVGPTRRSSKTKVVFSAFALLAILGGALGALAAHNGSTAAHQGEPSKVEDEQKRGLKLIGPTAVVDRAPKVAVPQQARTVAQATSVNSPPPPRPNPCEPPYTVDPASGHRTYKRNCF